MNLEAVVSSINRPSHDKVTVNFLHKLLSDEGASCEAPTAMMHTCGGVMISQNCDTPKEPRFDIEKEACSDTRFPSCEGLLISCKRRGIFDSKTKIKRITC